MGSPSVITPSNSTSWVDYWIDNTNYCAFFGCEETESTVGGNGCCVGSTLLSHLDPTYNNPHSSALGSDGCATSMSRSLRIRSACGADTVEDDDWSIFAMKHDAFLDSLLREQQQQLLVRSLPSTSNVEEDCTGKPSSSEAQTELNTSAVSLTTTHSWSLSPTSSADSVSDNGFDSTRYNSDGSVNRKRRRGLLLVATPRISQQ